MSYLETARRVLNDKTDERENRTKETKKVPLPVCTECGAFIVGPVSTWWGGEPVHYACGEAAWRREWKGETPARGDA